MSRRERILRAYFLVMACIGQVCTAFVLATEGLWWMAGGQLVTMGWLLTYAYEARKAWQRDKARTELKRTSLT